MNPSRFLLLLTLLAGCSRPSYVYRFHNKSQFNDARVKSTTETESVTMLNPGQITDGDRSTTFNHRTNTVMLASASPTPVIHKKPVANLTSHQVARKKNSTATFNKSPIAGNQQVPSEDEGDPKKNMAASVGLAFSLVSLIILFYGFLFTPVLAIPGLILSVIGLKSEHKKRAKTGLILSIAALALGLIVLILLAISGGYGA